MFSFPVRFDQTRIGTENLFLPGIRQGQRPFSFSTEGAVSGDMCRCPAVSLCDAVQRVDPDPLLPIMPRNFSCHDLEVIRQGFVGLRGFSVIFFQWLISVQFHVGLPVVCKVWSAVCFFGCRFRVELLPPRSVGQQLHNRASCLRVAGDFPRFSSLPRSRGQDTKVRVQKSAVRFFSCPDMQSAAACRSDTSAGT